MTPPNPHPALRATFSRREKGQTAPLAMGGNVWESSSSRNPTALAGCQPAFDQEQHSNQQRQPMLQALR
jgi:hypothetical protein